MAKKMTADVKARLAAAAAAKRARDTLMGLDQTLGLVALDNVQDLGTDVPRVRVTADGRLAYDFTGITFRGFPNVRTWYIKSELGGDQNVRRAGLECPWVRLSRAPDWLKSELANRWPSRTIAYPTRTATGGGWESAPVFPAAVVVAWFRFVWPEPDEWAGRVQKYVMAYTDHWTHRCPGIGVKLRVRFTQKLTKSPIPAVDAEVSEISPRGVPDVTYTTAAGTYAHEWLDAKRDEWELL